MKYRIVTTPWVGQISGKVREGFSIEEKWLSLFWVTYGNGKIFDTIEDAEDYINNFILKQKNVIKEYTK